MGTESSFAKGTRAECGLQSGKAEYLIPFLESATEYYYRWVATSNRNVFSQFQKLPDV